MPIYSGFTAEQLGEILNAGGMGLWEYDHRSGASTWNPHLYIMLGLAEGDPDADPDRWLDRVHPYDRPEVEARMQAAVAAHHPRFDAQFRMRRGDGRWLWVHSRGGVVERDAAGRPLRTAGILSDIDEWKALEASRAQSEERLRLIAETIDEVVWMGSVPLTRVDYVSPAYERIWRRPAAALMARPESFFEAIHPDDLEAVRAELANWNGDQPFDHEYRIVRPDGSIRWIRDRGLPVADASGAVTRFVGLAQDITGRRQAEEELRRSEATARQQRDELDWIYRNAPIGLCLLDLDLRYRRINQRLAEINGLPVEAHLGRTMAEVLPGLAAFADEMAAEVLAAGRTVRQREISGETAAAPGVLRHWEASWHPVFDSEGRIAGFGAVVEEITERKRAEADIRQLNAELEARVAERTAELEEATRQLRISGERYRTIVETAREGIWVIDAEGRNTFTNACMTEMLGYEPGEMDGRSLFDFMDEAARAECEQNLKRRQQGIAETHEFRLRRKDGGELWTHMSTNPLESGDGRYLGALAMVTDITERKRAEEALRLSRDDLQRAQAVGRIGSWRLDVRRNVLSWSAEAYRLFGIPEGTPLTYETFLAAVHPEDRDYVDRKWQAALAGEPYDIEHRVVVGQEVRWFREKAELEFGADGEPLGGFGTCQDITEAKEQEARLRSSEMHLRQAQRIAGVGSFLYDLAADRWTSSETLECILGIDGGYERTAAGWERLIHPEDRPRMLAALHDATVFGTPFDGEYRVLRLTDGALRWLAVSWEILRDAAGRPSAILGTNQDITARKEAEAGLLASQRLLREAERIGHLGAWQWDVDGDAWTCSEGWCRIHGCLQCLYTSAQLMRFVHPDDCSAVAETLRTAGTGAGRYDLEHRIVRGDTGEIRWVAARGELYRDPDGRRKLIGVAQDITERKRIEESLREKTELLQGILDHSPALIFVKDLNERYRLVNREVEELLGAKLADIRGKTAADFLPREIAEQISANDRTVIASGQAKQVEEIIPGPDGLRVQASELFLLPDRDGKPQYLCGIATDITERKRAEDLLLEADRHKDEFLAVLAHELRNPLAPMRNGLRILQLSADGPDLAGNVLEMMERQLHHMVRLIDDLLDISRVRGGKIVLNKAPVNLLDVVEQAVETSRPLITQNGHVFQLALPREPILVEADPVRLAQAFANLLNNAARYTAAGGVVALSVECYADAAYVRVWDNGVGIPPAMLDRIFDLFTQLDRTLERSRGGLGIGLSLVKSLVELHGGTVKAYSEGAGQGSEFTVRLPVLKAAGGGQEAGGDSDDAGPAAVRRRILVADDSPDAASSLAILLEMLGHEVRVAADGAEALEAAAAFRPDLALLDIGMPKVNGYDVCRRLRAEPWGQGVAIAAVTGWGQPHDLERSREAGFDRHFVKPMDPDRLNELLEELVRAAAGENAAGSPPE